MSDPITPAPQDPQGPNPYGTPSNPQSGLPQHQQPGYQQPHYQPPQYQQPGSQAPQGQPYAFSMPHDRPKSFRDAMPAGGLSGIFTTNDLPMEIKVSYWIWLVGGALSLLFSLFFGLIGTVGLLALAATTNAAGLAAMALVLVLVAIVLSAAQMILAMKMKEGKQWARLTLTILTVVFLLLSVGGTGWFGFVASIVATVFMWLPNSQAWFQQMAARA